MALCEVRIPTYRRPEWLERALRSLIAQDTPDWKGIIFDDSPDREGDAVVKRLNDPRLIYRPNSANLGCAANTDLCFSPKPYFNGDYACLLEDDNWFYPSFISGNIAALRETKTAICMRNQAVWNQFADRVEPTTETTLGDFYEDGTYSPAALCARLFLAYGISHGAMFWSLRECRSSLVVGPGVGDAGLAEASRTLRISEPVVFCSRPECAWTRMDSSLVARTYAKNRTFARGMDAIRRYVLKTHGRAILGQASALADSTQRRADFEKHCFACLHWTSPNSIGYRGALVEAGKSIAREFLVRNPVGVYLNGIKSSPNPPESDHP